MGNEEFCKSGWFLKRMADADGTDDYYMRQASGIRMVFDKNGGDKQRHLHVLCCRKNRGCCKPFRSSYC